MVSSFGCPTPSFRLSAAALSEFGTSVVVYETKPSHSNPPFRGLERDSDFSPTIHFREINCCAAKQINTSIEMQVLVTSLLIALSASGTAQVRHGSMDLVCVPPVGLDITLPAISAQKSLVLHVWASPTNALELKKMLAITATRCEQPNKCETGKGTLKFDHLVLDQKASGTYDVRFGNEEEKAAFAVKRRHQKRPFLCE